MSLFLGLVSGWGLGFWAGWGLILLCVCGDVSESASLENRHVFEVSPRREIGVGPGNV